MIATTTTQDLRMLREESDWVAQQLQRLQRVVTHVRPERSADRQRPAPPPA